MGYVSFREGILKKKHGKSSCSCGVLIIFVIGKFVHVGISHLDITWQAWRKNAGVISWESKVPHPQSYPPQIDKVGFP